MAHTSDNPSPARLTPLDDALARLLALARPVPAERRAVAASVGMIVAREVRASRAVPPAAVALVDGWAVNAENLVGASSYSAAILAPPPPWVDAGDPMPEATDAVLPPDTVTVAQPGMAEVSAPVFPGEGVRAAGADIAEGELLLAAGTRLAARHLAILAACEVVELEVRVPRVRLVFASAIAAGHVDFVRRWMEPAGVEVHEAIVATGERAALADAYRARGADLVLGIGGTGLGRADRAIAALADAGAVAVHGVALTPGGAAAFGQGDGTLVLLLPQRLDALLAALLLLACPLLAALSGAQRGEGAAAIPVTDKVVSVIGVAELFLALPDRGGVRPVALEGAGFADLAAALGWFLVAPGQEGFAAGQAVQVRPFSPR
jgi:molybdopterin biosynthesis enzyme